MKVSTRRKREDLADRLRANAYALERTLQHDHDRQLAALLREAAQAIDPRTK